MWVKNRYPKWKPGRRKQRLKRVVFWWVNLDPYPHTYVDLSARKARRFQPAQTRAKMSPRGLSADCPLAAPEDEPTHQCSFPLFVAPQLPIEFLNCGFIANSLAPVASQLQGSILSWTFLPLALRKPGGLSVALAIAHVLSTQPSQARQARFRRRENSQSQLSAADRREVSVECSSASDGSRGWKGGSSRPKRCPGHVGRMRLISQVETNKHVAQKKGVLNRTSLLQPCIIHGFVYLNRSNVLVHTKSMWLKAQARNSRLHW